MEIKNHQTAPLKQITTSEIELNGLHQRGSSKEGVLTSLSSEPKDIIDREERILILTDAHRSMKLEL